MQPVGSETGYQVVANGYASTNPIATGHQSHLAYHKVVYYPLTFLIYINNLDTNIVRNKSKFADDTKLCHKARNHDDIMELQEWNGTTQQTC